MKAVCLIVACLLTSISVSPSEAKEWRGIKPLDSTRADVKRLLGTPQQSTDHAFYYSLPEEIAVIWFQSGPCDRFGIGWNIPSGTVTAVGVIPKAIFKKEKFLSGHKFDVQEANATFIYYSDKTSGFSVETLNGTVTSLEYSPTDQEDNRRCPQTQECCIDFLTVFDEYDNPSFQDEKARLANLFLVMKERLGRAVIVVYGRNRKERINRMKRAQRAKSALLQEHALESQRILIVDGGYRGRPATVLNLHSIGGLVGRIHLLPEKDPESRRKNVP